MFVVRFTTAARNREQDSHKTSRGLEDPEYKVWSSTCAEKIAVRGCVRDVALGLYPNVRAGCSASRERPRISDKGQPFLSCRSKPIY